MEYKDYYKTLGVERSADQDGIRKAFRRLAAKYHPDRNKAADAEERFKEVNEAYEVLGDTEKRSRYDQLGANWNNTGGFQPPPGWGGGSSFQFDPNDFQGFSGGQGTSGFSDFFESLFGGGFAQGRTTQGARHGQHAHHTHKPAAQNLSIQLSLENLYSGTEKTIRLPDGSNVQVRIPAGMAEGKKLRLSGKGPHGSDIHLQIKLKPHARFRLEGRDIYTDVPITPWEAALGGNIAVPTPGGDIMLKLPPNSQSGKKMRLKGRGMPGNTAGDLYAVLSIQTPPAETDEQKAFYAQMQTLFDWIPRQPSE